MRTIDFHCQVDEDVFSWTVFLTRVFSGVALIYMAAGCLLYYREFLSNAVFLGLPAPFAVSFGVAAGLVLLGLLLMLGWFTRWVAGVSVGVCALGGVLFFAGNFNKIYVALIFLLTAALLPAMLLGPGKISLDYKHARRRAEKSLRG